jgi:hypothetical protein
MIGFAEAEARMRAKGVHPAIDMFPYIQGEEWVGFVESVRDHGVLNAIHVLPDGTIIDGRMRFLAGTMTGRPVPERVFEGDERAILKLIVSTNLIRTHFTSDQKAGLAADAAAKWDAEHGLVRVEPELGLRFDYTGMDPAARTVAVAAVAAIRMHGRRAAESIIAIGLELTTAKSHLPHGSWLPWLRAEFGWSERQAQNFMRAAAWAKSAKFADLSVIDISALYLLSSPSTPESVREAARERVDDGERVTHGFIKREIAKSKGTITPEREAARLRAEIERLRARLAEIEAGANG